MTQSLKSLVIVDDSPVIMTLIKKIVEGIEAHVELISDYNEAVAHCAHHKIDLLITDLNIGANSGFELISACRSNPQNIQTNSFIMSADSSKDFKEKMKTLNVRGWILKPLEPRSMRQMIQNLLA